MSCRLLVAAGLSMALALAGCAPVVDSVDGGEDAVPGAGGEPAVPGGDPSVPEECAGPFPLAFGTPDEGNLELRPADWPAPPAGSVLCGTGGTVTGEQEDADYAFDGGEDAVFAHYETALAGTAPERVELGTGPGLSGSFDGILYVVKPVDGGFTLVFQKDDR